MSVVVAKGGDGGAAAATTTVIVHAKAVYSAAGEMERQFKSQLTIRDKMRVRGERVVALALAEIPYSNGVVITTRCNLATKEPRHS